MKLDKIKSGKGIEYYNIPVAFDIETSSWHEYNGKIISPEEIAKMSEKDKHSVIHKGLMYEWTFNIDGNIKIGRTWDEFYNYINDLRTIYKLNETRRMIVWVHNLAFELEWIKNFFHWNDKASLCLDTGKPAVLVSNEGFEFRCSYIYTGKALKDVQLFNSQVSKDVGDLDYTLIRTPETPLTDKELQYCIDDTQVVIELVKQDLPLYGSYCNFPSTKTGKVKRHIINNLSDGYYNKISRLSIDKEEYQVLRKAFGGGYSHASWMNIDELINNIYHYDLNSSYIAVMALMAEFPISKGKKITKLSTKEFKKINETKAWVAMVSFTNLKAKFNYEYYLSESKLSNTEFEHKSSDVFNGRVKNCKYCETYITNIDLKIIDECYTYDSMGISTMYVYDKGYLPKEFIELMLDSYVKKTSLKGIKGKEQEYHEAKVATNSYYGICAMDIMRDVTAFNGEYVTYANANKIGGKYDRIQLTGDDCIVKANGNDLTRYNKSRRFTSYSWAPFITALARYVLWLGILSYKDSYLYTDTDSLFITDDTNTFIGSYNAYVTDYLIPKASKELNISLNKFIPLDMKGIAHPLGIWEKEKNIKQFKTLGSKRYVIVTEDGLELTCSGVNKASGSAFIENLGGISKFSKDLVFPVYSSGRMMTYKFDSVEGTVKDYLGNEYNYSEGSGVSLLPVEYSMDDLTKMLYFIEVNSII